MNTENKPQTRLTSKDFKVGMRVKVLESEISYFSGEFAKKIQNREGIVTWVSKYDNLTEARQDRFYAGHVNRIQVEFQKRNGRGKPFTEMLMAGIFEILSEPSNSELATQEEKGSS